MTIIESVLTNQFTKGFFFEPRRTLSFAALEEESPVEEIPQRPAGNGWAARLWDNMYGAGFDKQQSPLKRDVTRLLRKGNSLRSIRTSIEVLLGEEDSSQMNKTEAKRRRLVQLQPTMEPRKTIKRPVDSGISFSPRAFILDESLANKKHFAPNIEKSYRKDLHTRKSKTSLLKSPLGTGQGEPKNAVENRSPHWMSKFLVFGNLVEEVGSTFQQYVTVS